MKAVHLIVIAALACAMSTALADDEDAQLPPSAPELLRQVIRRLPTDPIETIGTLTVTRKRATVLSKQNYWMRLDWGKQPALASYAVMDMTGSRLARMDFSRTGNKLDLTFFRGESTVATNAPALTARVHGTDITWLDLSLDFLWWDGAEHLGTDKLRGRLCDVVIVPAPDGLRNCAAAKLWIDRKYKAMLKAEQLNVRGEVMRAMKVESLKKRNDRWMIKELEIQSFPGDHRTTLRVKDVSTPTP